MLNDDRDTIFRHGHRVFVGGVDDFLWTRIGALQFDFLRAQGLQPNHVLFDIACGALRGGVHYINYLEAGRYVGFDKYIELVILGVSQELGTDNYRRKQPRFRVCDDFNFSGTGLVPDYAIAQSLFSHLTADDIRACLRGLARANTRRANGTGLRFFATFFEAAKSGARNPALSHSHGHFLYTRGEMEAFGTECGFTAHYIGDWQHPRGQHMIEYRLTQ